MARNFMRHMRSLQAATAKAAAKAPRRVVRVTQSPMNAKQWSLDLACGHDKWVTAARKPKRPWEDCEECARNPEGFHADVE